jgi:nucleoside-diphosphate-sugar epimerase
MSEISARADQHAEQVFASRKSDLAPADVLVTGAAGFLGSALTRRLLDQGKTVRVLMRRASAAITALGPVQVVIGDLGDPDIVDHAVKGVRVIYHVGAAMRGSPEQFRSGTTVGVRNVIESSLRYGIERLVYVSSLSVMDHAGRPEKQVLKEDSAYEPYPERRGLYTQTKLDAEQAIHAAIANRGLPAVVVRPGQIFGVGAERVPPNGVIALAGRWILVGNGKSSLPLVYLDDVVDALLLAGERPNIAGKTFNVVDSTLVTQTEYLAACQVRLGASLKLKRVPTWIMLRLGHALEMVGKVLRRELPLSRYRVRSLRPLANFDDSAARLVLGWQPRVGVREGLRRTFVVTDGPSGK